MRADDISKTDDGPVLVDDVLAGKLARAGLRVAFAESCTGGMVAASVTQRAGASVYFAGSAVCYCDRAKRDVLGVDGALLEKEGAVSAACACAMADGALRLYACDIALSVSGFAGPDGERVGEVYVGWAVRGKGADAQKFVFEGDRARVRCLAARAVLQKLSNLL